jgi:hypothetical protein
MLVGTVTDLQGTTSARIAIKLQVWDTGKVALHCTKTTAMLSLGDVVMLSLFGLLFCHCCIDDWLFAYLGTLPVLDLGLQLGKSVSGMLFDRDCATYMRLINNADNNNNNNDNIDQ